jgi:hypothetical protein
MKRSTPYTTLLMKELVRRTWYFVAAPAVVVYFTVAMAESWSMVFIGLIFFCPFLALSFSMQWARPELKALPLSWRQIVTIKYTHCALIAPLVLTIAACGGTLAFLLFTGSASKLIAFMCIVPFILAAQGWLVAVMRWPSRWMRLTTLIALVVLLGCLFIPNKGSAMIFVLLIDMAFLATALGYMFELGRDPTAPKEHEVAKYEEWKPPARTSLWRFYVAHAAGTAYRAILYLVFIYAFSFLLNFITGDSEICPPDWFIICIVASCSGGFGCSTFRELRSLPMKPAAILFWKLKQTVLFLLILLVPFAYYFAAHVKFGQQPDYSSGSILNGIAGALLCFSVPLSFYIAAIVRKAEVCVLTPKTIALTTSFIILFVVLLIVSAKLGLSSYFLIAAALGLQYLSIHGFFYILTHSSAIYRKK